MKIVKGDKVTVIDEDLKGKVIAYSDSWVEFESDDGFIYKYPLSAVYLVNSENEVSFISEQINLIPKDADLPKKFEGIKPIKFDKTKSIFDLHLEELLEERSLKRGEVALQLQIDYASEVLNRAIALRVRQLVFIHGRGGGILRDELRNMISERFPNVEFFDGDYIKYGQGATEVIIHGLGSL